MYMFTHFTNKDISTPPLFIPKCVRQLRDIAKSKYSLLNTVQLGIQYKLRHVDAYVNTKTISKIAFSKGKSVLKKKSRIAYKSSEGKSLSGNER